MNSKSTWYNKNTIYNTHYTIHSSQHKKKNKTHSFVVLEVGQGVVEKCTEVGDEEVVIPVTGQFCRQ